MCYRLVKYLSSLLCKLRMAGGCQSPLPLSCSPLPSFIYFSSHLLCVLTEYPDVTTSPCYSSAVCVWSACVTLESGDNAQVWCSIITKTPLGPPSVVQGSFFLKKNKQECTCSRTSTRESLPEVLQRHAVTKIPSGRSDWNSQNALWWQIERAGRDPVCQEPDGSHPSQLLSAESFTGGRGHGWKGNSLPGLCCLSLLQHRLNTSCQDVWGQMSSSRTNSGN